MDLLIRLEKQARRAGGQLHALTGNHEAMSVYGDLRYVRRRSIRLSGIRTRNWCGTPFMSGTLNNSSGTQPPEALPIFDEAYRERCEARHPLGFFERRFHFVPNVHYGKWLRGHSAVVRINDTLFVHGGISPNFAGMAARFGGKVGLADVGLSRSYGDTTGTLVIEEGSLYAFDRNGANELLTPRGVKAAAASGAR